MEIQAENRFVLTSALFIEGRLALSRQNFGKASKKIAIALLSLLLVLIVGSVLLQMSLFAVAMELLILALMSFWLFDRFPRSSAKRAYKALVKQWGDEPERITRFYEHELEIEGPGVHVFLAYSQIEQIKRTRHLLVLITDEKGGVLLKPDGFTIGSEAKVRELIR